MHRTDLLAEIRREGYTLRAIWRFARVSIARVSRGLPQHPELVRPIAATALGLFVLQFVGAVFLSMHVGQGTGVRYLIASSLMLLFISFWVLTHVGLHLGSRDATALLRCGFRFEEAASHAQMGIPSAGSEIEPSEIVAALDAIVVITGVARACDRELSASLLRQYSRADGIGILPTADSTTPNAACELVGLRSARTCDEGTRLGLKPGVHGGDRRRRSVAGRREEVLQLHTAGSDRPAKCTIGLGRERHHERRAAR